MNTPDRIWRIALICNVVSVVILAIGVATQQVTYAAYAVAAVLVFSVFVLSYLRKAYQEKFHWYEGILHAVPLPLSVTDLDMNWTFVNKVVEDLLGKKGKEVEGMQCSNWGANICKTENCGVACLRRGEDETMFNQWSRDFTVKTHYLKDLQGKEIGHVEVVQDVTEVKALSALMEKMKRYVVSLLESSESLSDNATRISASSEETSVQAGGLAAGMEQTAQMVSSIASASVEVSSNLNSVAAAMEEMARSIDVMTQNSIEGKRLSDEATASATKANSIMLSLSKSAEETGEVTGLIKDIAEQTNLLALNATIEAARAGEMGKGFAVVANEVKNLANQSAGSADEIVGRILSMQHVSEDASAAILNVNTGIENVAQAVNEINGSIEQQKQATDEVCANISQATEGSHEAAENINQASDTIKEMAANIHQISEAAQNNSESIQEIDKSINDLKEVARELNSIIAQYGR
ncbi:PAS domain-containing methyl-accepting chemotaxis protein [Thalassospira lucentensis]|uniref:PAS domain-containing methyl-accepting chemotaxis protein n=1 Tax=Thalassospira lucentensis TaxID=168935 RepID=UPI00142D9C29|nr:PAS domain-containing methyl-accepting chemotaxis protein [Thalassospira lucentensis]NIZ02927.1 PAS domain-containing protein [Thalassospira lucentensis]